MTPMAAPEQLSHPLSAYGPARSTISGTPLNIGSHCRPETPGSIHEGGELGHVLSHACGAAFDNPELIVTAVVGDGEAETGPLATSWQTNKFLNPIRDGAVLPVLQLNGYKINNPTHLARISHEELNSFFRGHGWTPYFVEGSDPESMHQAMAATLEHCISEIRKYQNEARRTGVAESARWPMIVLRTPKGSTTPQEVDGDRFDGSWQVHQVPMADVKKNPERLHQLENWMRSYKPEELSDEHGALTSELKELAPIGVRRIGANPHANGGHLKKAFRLPGFQEYTMHVRGFKERGNINTPLELATVNEIDRFSLAMDVIKRAPRLQPVGAHVLEHFGNMQIACQNYAYEHGTDIPEVAGWR